MFNIETPEQSSEVQENTSFGNVHSRTNSSATAKAEIIALTYVWMRCIFSR